MTSSSSPWGDRVAWRHRDRDHGSGQRRAHGGVAVRQLLVRRRRGGEGPSRGHGRGELGGVPVEVADVERAEPRRLEQRLQQARVDRHPGDVELGQRPHRPACRLLQRAAGGDHLGQQRVVARADRVARVARGVDADAAPGRGLEPAQRAVAGQQRAVRPQGLGVDPGLHGHPARRRVQGQRGEGGAVGDAQPELDQVQPGDLFGDRVLDLQPGVDLEEGDLVVLDQELGGGQARVAGRADQGRRGRGQPGADLPGQRRRGDLDQLLPAPLQAAVPVAEDRHGARAVTENLDLDVPGPGQQLLGVHPPVAERRRRLGGAPAHGFGQLGLGQVLLPGHRPQPAPAAAGHRLDHDRTVLAQQGTHLLRRGVDAGSGQHGHAELTRPGPGRGLVAEQRQCLRPRAGEAQPGRGAPRG